MTTSPSLFFIILVVMFLGILFFNLSQKNRQTEVHRCPKCDSTNVIETDHQTLDSRTVIPNGANSVAMLRVQPIWPPFAAT